MPASLPEVWLRGPVEGVAPELMPVVHSLLQIREEVASLVPALSLSALHARPGGAASIAFHLRHLAGSLDRLLTYARGESLTPAQQNFLATENSGAAVSADQLLQLALDGIDKALIQVRATPVGTLRDARVVGRAQLPSTVLGLLFHAAEHAQRHAGQVATMARVVANLRFGD
jgi:uncharacterized damage-inducible protein DinB